MNPNELTDLKALLSNDLAFLLPGFMILKRIVWISFFESASKPTLDKRWLELALLVLAGFVAFANKTIHPDVEIVAQLWWVQALLFWCAMLLADRALETWYRTPAPEGSGPQRSSGGLVPGLATGLMTLLVAGGAQAAPAWLSFDRASGGLAAQGAIYTHAAESESHGSVATFAPKAWLSYSLLDEVSAHVSGQWGLNPRIDEFHAGGAVRLLHEDPVRVAAAVDAVWYDDTDPGGVFNVKPDVEYSLRFSKVLKRESGAPRLGVQLQAGWVPARADKGEFTYRAGLNWHVFGGRVTP